ncbi:putative MFS monocarboxylate transporter [Aspergillus heteromorphus CBS 117.55]|uniref:Putative MFS monocarboxylate transporter n=1 Tax=Aspergillus heteromorphus CBS 117.55 TaxID=1448321 RepID=A0A317VQ90_9EURO|nr:putative MFS monocarboxylate transporter [Aspergillus heteromorphus CBS 117.55]PWY75042.1 putative MFS monocarboxylate transporter [Aspergillus heteromorphus CBS 117.55]
MSDDLEKDTNVATLPQENAPAPKPPHFPEGGFKAWMAVLSCWCVMFNTFGYINAFGIYEAYYSNTFLKNESDSNIAWIGSIQAFFMFSAGLISGPLMDRYGPRVILIPFSLLFILSVMFNSLCTEYWQFILAQGIFGGFVNGLTYTPTLAAVNQYFFKRRPLAMGIASSGSSLAGVIFPIALNRMLNESNLGFGWSVRIVGFLMLALSVIACLSVSSPAPKRKSGTLFIGDAWRHPAYSFQVAGLFFIIWALFVPFFYIPSYAQSIGIDVNLSNYLISISNAGSFVGRLLSGALANRIGRFNTLVASSAICGILILCWMAIESLAGMVVFSILFGFFSGNVIGMFTGTIALTAPRPNVIGSYMGMALGVLSLASLTGTPITGAMINTYGNYNAALIFAGILIPQTNVKRVCHGSYPQSSLMQDIRVESAGELTDAEQRKMKLGLAGDDRKNVCGVMRVIAPVRWMC